MKQFKLTASVFVSTLILSSATFAQLSLKGESLANGPYNWTGFYAGLNAGVVNHTLNITDDEATSFLATIQQVQNHRFTGGFQVGYLQQLDYSMVSGVYGAEFSGNFSNTKFKKEYGSPFALYQLSSTNELKNAFLLEIIGGIAANRTLLFLAGGLSWTDITGSLTNDDSIAFFNSLTFHKKEFGTAIGAGIEYAFCDSLSARIKVDVITPNTYSTTDDADDSFQISNNIVQATLGINYKFA